MASLENLTAQDVMSKNVVTLRADMSLREATETLTEEGISGAPVVDSSERLVGVISLSDIAGYEVGRVRSEEVRRSRFYQYSDSEGYERPEETGDLSDEDMPEEIMDSTSVAMAMTPMTITVGPQTPLIEVARIMIRERIHRVLVTEMFKIIGLVSSMDLLRAIAEPARRPTHRHPRKR
jgi:CBS domain-containing protein